MACDLFKIKIWIKNDELAVRSHKKRIELSLIKLSVGLPASDRNDLKGRKEV